MTPTEHELTVATLATAKAMYESYRGAVGAGAKAWDELTLHSKRTWMQGALPAVVATLQVLPDRLEPVRRLLDDELTNLADDGARSSHSLVRRLQALVQ